MAFIKTPVPRTWLDDTTLTQEMLNTEIRDALRFIISGCACTMSLNTDQNIPTSTVTDVVWDTQLTDVDGIITPPSAIFTFQRSGVISVRFTGTLGAFTGGDSRNFRLEMDSGSGFNIVGGISDGPSTVSGQQVAGTISIDVPVLAGYRIKFSAYQNSGSTIPVKGGGKTRATITWVGKTVDDLIFDNGPDPTPAPSPSPNPVTKHTKTYAATWSRSYEGGAQGHITRDGDPPLCYQGWYSSQYGTQKSLIGFDSATIVSDLSNAQLVSMILTFYVSHTHFDTGSTVIVGGHHYVSAPSVWAQTSVTDDLQRVQANQNKSVSLWLNPDFRAGVASGQYKGIAIGPAPHSTQYYFLYLNGALQSSKPKLDVVYYS